MGVLHKRFVLLGIVLLMLSVASKAALVEVGTVTPNFSQSGDVIDFGGIQTKLEVVGSAADIGAVDVGSLQVVEPGPVDDSGKDENKITDSFDVVVLPSLVGKSISIEHQVVPSSTTDWDPSKFAFSLDTVLSDGQFVDIPIDTWVTVRGIDKGKIVDKQVWGYKTIHWEKGDKNSLVFDADHVLHGQTLMFNSFSRNFESEHKNGFTMESVSIVDGVVSAVFKTTDTTQSGSVKLGDLVTQSTAITSNTTWFDQNTYFINVDSNLDVTNNAVLTIQPGTVVKFKASSGNTFLAIKSGARVVADGNADANILFLSCKDQNTFVHSIDANTAAQTGCAGAPAFGDYNTALDIQASSGMGFAHSLSYLKIFNAKIGIQEDVNLLSIHDSNFSFVGAALANGSGIRPSIDVNTAIYNNYFSRIAPNGNGIFIGVSSNRLGASITNNVFTTFNQDSSTGINISDGGNTVFGSIQDNKFIGFFSPGGNASIYALSPIKGGIRNNLFTGDGLATVMGFCQLNFAIYNNVFLSLEGVNVFYDFCAPQSTGQILNNSFYDVSNSSTVFITDGSWDGTIQRNIFLNISTLFGTTQSANMVMSNNAYVTTTNNATLAKHHTNDQNSLTGFNGDPWVISPPNSLNLKNYPRGFLLNTNTLGGAKLVDAGGVAPTGVDINNYFNLRTTQTNNRLDRNIIDIGFHPDQNTPFVQVIRPNDSNTLSGTQSVDFNVESGFGTTATVSARLGYSDTNTTTGTLIVNQALSAYSCSALPIATCSYAWNTLVVPDQNFFIATTATDTNGSFSDWSDRNFLVSNPVTVLVVFPNDANYLGGVKTFDFNLTSLIGAVDLNIDLNLSDSNVMGTGTPILLDGNVAKTVGLFCDSNSISVSKTCHFSFNTASIGDGNYFLLVKTRALNKFGFDASDRNFVIDNSSPQNLVFIDPMVFAQDFNRIRFTFDENFLGTVNVFFTGVLSSSFVQGSACSRVGSHWTCDFNASELVSNNSYVVRVDVNDLVGNSNTATTSFFFGKVGGAGGSPGTGGVTGQTSFSVLPDSFTPGFGVLFPRGTNSFLPVFYVRNDGATNLLMRYSFVCSDENCVVDWCQPDIPNEFVLKVGELKAVNLFCSIPAGVEYGRVYDLNLVFVSGATEKSFTAQLPVSANPLLLPAKKNLIGDFLNFGLVCFGSEKKDCLSRFGVDPLYENGEFRITYIALFDLLLVIGVLIWVFLKFPWVLVGVLILAVFGYLIPILV